MESLALLEGRVWHERVTPRRNAFSYSVYYVAHRIFSRTHNPPILFSYNRFNILTFFDIDHGRRDGTSVVMWLHELLDENGITLSVDDDVVLIAHPRLFGYAFNPISYWLVLQHGALVAVACEVHNTFGDNYTYVLKHTDMAPILPTDVLHAKKQLYVSPFNTMQGRYEFSFTYDGMKFTSVINYFENDALVLRTGVGGPLSPLTTRSILSMLVWYPLMTLRVVARIHLQAVRLYMKGVVLTLHERPRKR